ncbi:MAG: hypothetical protein NTX19_08500 [Gemmatimonadetes bacterium]|nr:hypothetical protein [Gemmatimonadota bacterium]
MFALALAGVIVMGGVDTLEFPRAANSGPREAPAGVSAPATDTVARKRAKAVELSDWYATRLSIHKAASWAMIPLFVGQYYTGQTLINEGTDSPEWVKRTHPVLATGVLALFATNTVTGVWNLIETRDNEKGRAWRTTHAILMLASDAGFAYVGQLSRTAKQSGDVRNQHRTAAILSGSAALASYLMMLSPIRRD